MKKTLILGIITILMMGLLYGCGNSASSLENDAKTVENISNNSEEIDSDKGDLSQESAEVDVSMDADETNEVFGGYDGKWLITTEEFAKRLGTNYAKAIEKNLNLDLTDSGYDIIVEGEKTPCSVVMTDADGNITSKDEIPSNVVVTFTDRNDEEKAFGTTLLMMAGSTVDRSSEESVTRMFDFQKGIMVEALETNDSVSKEWNGYNVTIMKAGELSGDNAYMMSVSEA